MTKVFTKRGSQRAIDFEAAGLRELAAAGEAGGAPTARLVSVGAGFLETELIVAGRATRAAAHEFGRKLAYTHAYSPAGRVFGQAPAGFTHARGVMGAIDLPLVPAGTPGRRFGEFYAADRLLPYLPTARNNGSISASGTVFVERLCEKLDDGEFDAPQPELVTAEAALLHGDLWSGNIMWAHSGTVGTLIDPASHGGHAESDLAQLHVFGAPYAAEIYAGYQEVSPLTAGWEERIGLHQLHMLIIHAAIFGGGYGAQTIAVVEKYC